MGILIRHAPPLVEGLCAGRSDFAVQPTRESADRALEALTAASLRPSGVVSSPSRRCHDLARELARRLELPLALDARLCELDFGEWEGRAWDEIASADRERYERWMACWRSDAPPGGESITALEQRVGAWLNDEVSVSRVAVTHAGVIRAVRVLREGVTWEAAFSDGVPYLTPRTFVSAKAPR